MPQGEGDLRRPLIIGVPLGVRTGDWLPENVVRIGFGVFLLSVALRLFGEALGIF